MKIKEVKYYETSVGNPVKTIAEWKVVEMTAIVSKLESSAETLSSTTRIEVAEFIVANSDAIVEILSHKDKAGRPVGAKDKKPRNKPAVLVVAN